MSSRLLDEGLVSPDTSDGESSRPLSVLDTSSYFYSKIVLVDKWPASNLQFHC